MERKIGAAGASGHGSISRGSRSEIKSRAFDLAGTQRANDVRLKRDDDST